MRKSVLLACGLLVLVSAAAAKDVRTFAVNEYFGVPYHQEPVSFDVEFERPVPRRHISVWEAPWQVEILEGTPDAVKKARVWTLVDFDKPGQKLFTVSGDLADKLELERIPGSPLRFEDAGEMGGVKLQVFGNGRFFCKVPVGTKTFDPPVSAFEVPGPVVSVSRDGKEWVGSGYLDSMVRVKEVTCEVNRGPVYLESRIRYRLEEGKTYTARVRVYAGKPYAQIVEDFNLGGASRYVFNYDDWFADAFFRPGDQRLYGWQSIKTSNPCADFVRIEGQEALARLVVWSQFNYFGGKQETIALKAPDPKALEAAHTEALERYRQEMKRYEERLAEWKKDPEKNREPREPRRPQKPTYREEVHTLAGAPIRAASVATPGGDSTAVGAFYIRPDRWTRAKVNHVDLYMRPEVPGDRMTRGIVGLKGAVARVAMEAWLIDGHREWAIFAVRSGDRTWLAKAHVQEGVWPLDRLVRLPLVWNSDGSPVRPEHTVPSAEGAAGGAAGSVLLGTRSRSGLQYFNGSNGHIRGTRPPAAGWDGTVTGTKAEGGDTSGMAARAMTAYMAGDDSAYPSFRAMTAWTDPEAINPFYQGMENMNFNADLYRYVTTHGMRLAAMGHPEAMRFIKHGEKSLDMALDRYVYPQSGCWEESHGYAGHTLGVVGPLVVALKNSGLTNFLEDVRLARMMEFFLYVHSPVDAEFGNRIVPPVGDHGLSRGGPAGRLGKLIGLFTDAKNPEVRRIVRRAAWLIREDGGAVPEGVTPEKPDLSSRWLQGYGTVMRALGRSDRVLAFDLAGAIAAKDKGGKDVSHDLTLMLSQNDDGFWKREITGSAPTFNTARHHGTAGVGRSSGGMKLTVRVNVNADRWVEGGEAEYVINLKRQGDARVGTYSGTFNGREVGGKVAARAEQHPQESFLVLRAGQVWGHHHEDKGSMWFWGRNVHFFGDCDWGGPPGGTYWNKYKQGPASGTQIEFVGVTNWTLPCKYPAPWISDEQYAERYDYANARCMYPFNPRLDVSKSTPVALRSGYDRQVLFVHPDVLVVRDNVETVCPTIWRMHSYQVEGTKAKGNRATLASRQGVTGELAVLYPTEGVTFRVIDRDVLNEKYFDEDGKPLPHEKLPKFKSSVELRWDMPASTGATWVFGVHGANEKAPACELLDEEGRVTRVRLADGTEIIAMLNIEPFRFSGHGIEFDGTVGLVIDKDGKVTKHAIRAKRLEVK